MTERSLIQSVIIWVITKSDDREAGVWFVIGIVIVICKREPDFYD